MFNYSLLDGEKSEKVLNGWGISGIMKSIFGRIELMWARGDKDVNQPGEKSNKVYFIFGFRL